MSNDLEATKHYCQVGLQRWMLHESAVNFCVLFLRVSFNSSLSTHTRPQSRYWRFAQWSITIFIIDTQTNTWSGKWRGDTHADSSASVETVTYWWKTNILQNKLNVQIPCKADTIIIDDQLTCHRNITPPPPSNPPPHLKNVTLAKDGHRSNPDLASRQNNKHQNHNPHLQRVSFLELRVYSSQNPLSAKTK